MATSGTFFVHPDADDDVSVGFHTVTGDYDRPWDVDLWIDLKAGGVDVRVSVDTHQLRVFGDSLVHMAHEINEFLTESE